LGVGEYVKFFDLNQLTVARGLRGLAQLLGSASWILTFLAFFLSEVESFDTTLWLFFVFLTWVTGLSIKNDAHAMRLQFICLTLVLGTPFFLSNANADSWIPITVIGLTLICIIALGTPSRIAFALIIATVLLIWMLIQVQENAFLYGGALYKNGTVSVSYLTVVGFTAWFLKAFTMSQARKFDQSMSLRMLDLEIKRNAQYSRQLNSRLARKLHESVLNTFSAIQKIRDVKQLNELREYAKQDLHSLDMIKNQIRAMPLPDLINESLLRSDLSNVVLEISPDCEIEVSAQTLPALQDSLIEAFRNIARHANATRVQVLWKCKSEFIELHVIDDGDGFNLEDKDEKKYGLHVIKNKALADLGHEVVIGSTPGIGTHIEWRLIELKTIKNPGENIDEWPKVTQENLLFRYLFLVIPTFIGAISMALTMEFVDQVRALVQYSLYLFLLIAYATLAGTRFRYPFLVTLIAAILAGQIGLINQVEDCSDALPIQWLVNGYTVGLLLIALSSSSTILKVVLLVSDGVVLGILARSLRTCQEIILLPGLTGLVLAVGMIIGLNRLTKQNSLTIASYQRALDELLNQDLQQRAAEFAFLRMQSMTTDSRNLLEEIIRNSDNLDFDSIKEKTRIQEAYLRSSLLIIESTRDDIQQVMLEMLSKLAQRRVYVSLENWSHSLNELEWPQELTDFGYQVSESLSDGICRIAFVDVESGVQLTITASGKFSFELIKPSFVVMSDTDGFRAEIILALTKSTSPQIEQQH
jgi:signal transduction histidine kinase